MSFFLDSFHRLCRAQAPEVARQLEAPVRGVSRFFILVIILGCASYGFTLGMGRATLMGWYVAVKLPLLIFLTLTVNALLNGILAQVLGSDLSFRQTGQAILRSFAIFAIMVGSISPVTAYLTLNTDVSTAGNPGASNSYSILLLLHVAIMATAGIVANFRLFAALRLLLPNPQIARNVLLAWLLGNLFVGAQFSYLLRPFFGQPKLEIQFLRPDAFVGNFYDTVWKLSRHLIGAGGVCTVIIFALIIFLLCLKKQSKPN